MGPMGMLQPMRQVTAKVVPVVVSAGLAIGVFCGLLFGLGTGKSATADPQKVSNGVKANDDSKLPDTSTTTTTPKTVPTPPPKGTPGGASGGSAVPAGAG